MPKISTAEVERLAALARIGLSPEETEHFASEIGRIIEFVEQLQNVDITNTQPTDQVAGLVDVWREDVVIPSPPRSVMLANAPDQIDGYIKVKRVLHG